MVKQQAQSRVKMLEKMETIRVPEDAARTVFTFPSPEELSPPIIATEDAATGYGNTIILRHMNLRIDKDDRIALLGRNGEGKSTLSKIDRKSTRLNSSHSSVSRMPSSA